MTVEEVEGEVRDLVVREPERLSALAPEDTITLATRMATALKDIVEKQRLYAVISGKKYPQVEAWMTIARMDNVVARESSPPVRNDDGSYEAFVELIRLSDGMRVGAGSALCGTEDDRPWNSRSEPARRSMAVTRATSRAFRQQYSWIMALAGYEPTPAEEMPHDPPRTAQEPRNVTPAPHGTVDDGYAGVAEVGRAPDGSVKSGSDFELRETANDGPVLGFRLSMGPRKGMKVVVKGDLATAVALWKQQILNRQVTCYGTVSTEGFDKARPDGTNQRITYQVLTLERIVTNDLVLPADGAPPVDASASLPGGDSTVAAGESELDALL